MNDSTIIEVTVWSASAWKIIIKKSEISANHPFRAENLNIFTLKPAVCLFK